MRPLEVLAAVRATVQGDIEPRAEGGALTVRTAAVRGRLRGHRQRPVPEGPAAIELPAAQAALPG